MLPKPNFEKADGKCFYCVDLWGYYNGATSSKDLISKEISFVDIGLPSLKRILRGSSDRKSNFKYAKAGVLNEIIFPTGGSQKCEYEPNVSTFNSVIDTIGGLRLKNIIISDNKSYIKKSYEYDLPIFLGLIRGKDDIKYSPLVEKSCSFFNDQPGNSYSSITYTLKPEMLFNSKVIYGNVVENIINSDNKLLGKIQYSYNTSLLDNMDVKCYENILENPIITTRIWNDTRVRLSNVLHNRCFIAYKPRHKFGPIAESQIKYYDAKDKLVRKITKDYDNKILNEFKGLNKKKMLNMENGSSIIPYDGREYDQYWRKNYIIEQCKNNLIKETTTDYLEDNENITIIKEYKYDDVYNLLKSEKIIQDENNYNQTNYKYTKDIMSPLYNEMKSLNMISYIVEKEHLNNGLKLLVEKLNYKKVNIKPRGSVYLFSDSENIYPNNDTVKQVEYCNYGFKGRLMEMKKIGQPPVVHLWSYFGTKYVAEIINATIEEVEPILMRYFFVNSIDSFFSKYQINDYTLLSGQLHDAFPNSLVSTYIYDSKGNIYIKVNPNKERTYYNYDSFNRIKEIIEDKSRTEYEYNYKK